MDGKRTEEKPLDKILNFPLNCCGTTYIARATGPNIVLIKYLSPKSYIWLRNNEIENHLADLKFV